MVFGSNQKNVVSSIQSQGLEVGAPAVQISWNLQMEVDKMVELVNLHANT